MGLSVFIRFIRFIRVPGEVLDQDEDFMLAISRKVAENLWNTDETDKTDGHG